MSFSAALDVIQVLNSHSVADMSSSEDGLGSQIGLSFNSRHFHDNENDLLPPVISPQVGKMLTKVLK